MKCRKKNRVARALLAGIVAASLALSPVMPAASVAFAAGQDKQVVAPGSAAAVAEEPADGAASDAAVEESAQNAPEGASQDASADVSEQTADADVAATDAGDAQAAGAERAAQQEAPAARSSVPAPPSSSVTSGCFLYSAPNKRYTTLADAIAAAQEGDTIYVVSDNLNAGTRSVQVDKSITITSASAARTVQCRYNFAYTQGAGTLTLENITFATLNDSIVWNKRRAPLFTLSGGNLMLGEAATITYSALHKMLQPMSDNGLTGPVRVGANSTFTMVDGASLIANSSTNIDANKSNPVCGAAVYVEDGGTMDMQGGSITGYAPFTRNLQGAAIYNKGTLTMRGSSSISDGKATAGGAVYNAGTMTLEDAASITNCKADEGGAIYNAEGGSLTLAKGASIAQCIATSGAGGGIWSRGQVELVQSAISGCSAERGGAIYLSAGAPLSMTDASITNNTAETAGSAICAENGNALTFAGTTKITDNTVSKTSEAARDAATDCAVAVMERNRPSTLSLEGQVVVRSNTGKGGVDANLSAGFSIIVAKKLNAASYIGIHDGGSDAYKIGGQVASIAPDAEATMEQAQLFRADGGNSTTGLDGNRVLWAGMCRIQWDAGSSQLISGGWKYYASLQAALDDIQANKQEKTIEMLVDHYEIRESKTFYTYKVPQGKYVRITTSSASEFANKTCTFSFPHLNLYGASGNTSKDAYCIFNVAYGAQLTLDGRNGTDGANHNGLIFDGGVSTTASEMKLSDAKQRAVIKNKGRCIVDDVTFRGFNSRCDSNSNRVYGLITSYAETSGNTDTSERYLELAGTTLIEHVKMYGGAVHEIAGGVGIFGGGFKIGSDVMIRDCYGPTGGLSVGEGAVGTFAGTIQGCSTLGDSDDTALSNQGGGGIFMSNDKPKVTGDTTLTIEGGRILDCVGNTDTFNVTAAAGGLYNYGGALKIHGITITGCSTNSDNKNAGGAMAFNTEKASNASISMDGLCTIKDNTTRGGVSCNLNLSSDTSAAYKTLYINVTGDMDPNSEVHVWAQYGGVATSSEARNSADKPFAYADGGDASKLTNLNTFVNDLHDDLHGVASYRTWTSNLNQSSPYPAAIIWNTHTTVKATKRVAVDDGAQVNRRFSFKATSSAQGFKGKVFSQDGTVLDELVTAYPDGHETADSTFTLGDGDYVLFDNIPVESGNFDLSQITITETDAQAGLSADPTVLYACDITEASGLGDVSTTGAPSWSRPAGVTQACDVVFTNTMRNASLKIGKTVTGDFADPTKAFTFHLTLHVPEGLTAPAQGYGATLYAADGSATTTRHAFTPDADGSFTLSDGQYLLFDGLPVGTTYDLSEDAADGYAASATVATLAQDGSDAITAIPAGVAGTGLRFKAADVDVARIAFAESGAPNTVQVTNAMPNAIPTGIGEGGTSWGIWIAASAVLAVGAAGVVLIRRRRMQA